MNDRKRKRMDPEAHSTLTMPPPTPKTDGKQDAGAVEACVRAITATTCGACGNQLLCNEGHIIQLSKATMDVCKKEANGDLSIANTASYAHVCLTCTSCHRIVCLGCGTPLSEGSMKYNVISGNFSLEWHCDSARLPLIWIVLCGYDREAAHNLPRLPTSLASNRKNKSAGVSGVGYAVGDHTTPSTISSSLGNEDELDELFAYPPSEPPPIPSSLVVPTKPTTAPLSHGMSTSLPPPTSLTLYESFMSQYSLSEMERHRHTPLAAKADPDHTLTTRTMTVLSLLLPDIHSRSQFDHAPPAVLSSMILESSILNRAADLLRNEDLGNVTERCGLYASLSTFVRMLATHHATSQRIIQDPRRSSDVGMDLLKTSFARGVTNASEKRDKSSPIAFCMSNLHTQAELTLASARDNEDAFETQEGQQMVQLCYDIVQLAKVLYSGAQDHASHPVPQWLEAQDENILKEFAYARQARSVTDTSRDRMRALFKDVNALKTGLPPGVFVRVASSRPDVMKVLVIGPEGTPYENGVFEFDLFCDANYPSEPPQMLFKTTGGGIARMNPNLYKDGKVCLSLLGTWEGEPWVPGQSTLLQLLVSTQAMIFCDEPYCNEPGYEDDMGSAKSRLYNKMQYPLTVQYAMLDWLSTEKPRVCKVPVGKELDELGEDEYAGRSSIAKPGMCCGDISGSEEHAVNKGIWDEVVKNHFEVNEERILKTVAGWIDDHRTTTTRTKTPAVPIGSDQKLQMPQTFAGDMPMIQTSSGDPTSKETSRLVMELRSALRKLMPLEVAKASVPH